MMQKETFLIEDVRKKSIMKVCEGNVSKKSIY